MKTESKSLKKEKQCIEDLKGCISYNDYFFKEEAKHPDLDVLVESEKPTLEDLMRINDIYDQIEIDVFHRISDRYGSLIDDWKKTNIKEDENFCGCYVHKMLMKETMKGVE